MKIDRKILSDYIKNHEGYRSEWYLDTLGFPTIGWGHLCIKNEYQTIDKETAEMLFQGDLDNAIKCVQSIFENIVLGSGIDELSANRQMAFVDMAFQLGHKLERFQKALFHVSKGEWGLAVADFLNSIWAKKQTPARAIDNAILLLEG